MGETGNPTEDARNPAPVIPSNSESVQREREAAERSEQIQETKKLIEETRKGNEETKTVEWLQFGVNAFLALVGTGAICVYYGQLREMRHTNELTQQALNGSDITLSQTLEKMQGQITQMSRVADQAAVQAAAAKSFCRERRQD